MYWVVYACCVLNRGGGVVAIPEGFPKGAVLFICSFIVSLRLDYILRLDRRKD